MTDGQTWRPALWLAVFAGALIWSGLYPHDRTTWVLEVTPALVGVVVLALTYRRFRLTDLAYGLILVHGLILMVGGHYTYAEVPLFDWLRDVTGGTRNQYDKVGHFAQGFVPALVSREVLKRLSPVREGGWLAFTVICFCLALSAVYELVEWWTAVAMGEAADAFLGTQGYAWDTQSDMAWALVGAVAAVLTLGRLHDRALARRPSEPEAIRKGTGGSASGPPPEDRRPSGPPSGRARECEPHAP